MKYFEQKIKVEEARRAVLFLMSQKDGNKGGLSPLGKPTIEVTVSPLTRQTVSRQTSETDSYFEGPKSSRRSSHWSWRREHFPNSN